MKTHVNDAASHSNNISRDFHNRLTGTAQPELGQGDGQPSQNRSLRSFLGVMSLAVLCLFVAAGCDRKNRTSAPQKEPLRIGAILPLSGDGAQYGQNVLDGINLAVEAANKAGGINGVRIEVLSEDSKIEAKLAISAFNKLRSQKVNALIDDAVSTLSLAMAPLLTGEQTVLISTGASNPALSGSSPFFFRVWNSDAFEGKVTADFLKTIPQNVTLAVLHVNNDYGKGLCEVVTRELKDSRARIVATETFDVAEHSFRNQIEKIRSSGASHIYLIGYAAQTGPATIQIREAGLKVPIIGTVAMEDKEYVRLAGANAEAVIYPFPSNPQGLASDSFRSAFRGKYGRDAGLLNDCGFDAANLLLSAFKSGARSGEDLRRFLSNVKDYQGASGDITFDKNGDVSKPMIIKTIQNGAFVPYNLNK